MNALAPSDSGAAPVAAGEQKEGARIISMATA